MPARARLTRDHPTRQHLRRTIMSLKFAKDESAWNTGGHEDFYTYYEKQSSGAAALRRFEAIQATLLRVIDQPPGPLRVADIGCGAGTQSRIWAAQGHTVF